MPRRTAVKVPTTTSDGMDVTESTVAKAGTKRGRSTHVDRPKSPAKKRSKNTGVSAARDESVMETDDIPQAMRLRPSRDAHPGIPAKPKPRRTPAEVATDKAKIKAAAAKAMEVETEKRDRLASMLLKEDAAAESEKQRLIRRRSQIGEDCGDDEVEAESEPAKVTKTKVS
jgi:hypothetical protein